MKTKCQFCDKALVIIGVNRVNGRDCFRDWDDRKFHKKCYKEYIFKMDLDINVKRLLNKWYLIS